MSDTVPQKGSGGDDAGGEPGRGRPVQKMPAGHFYVEHPDYPGLRVVVEQDQAVPVPVMAAILMGLGNAGMVIPLGQHEDPPR